MGHINSRSKGNRNERQAAGLVSKWTKKKFERTPSSGGLNWKASHAKGDITCTEDGYYFPFTIEVKAHRDINFSEILMPEKKNVKILEFWEQAKKEGKEANKIPMVMMRYNGLKKDFFFIIIPTTLFEFCIEPFFVPNKKAISFKDLTIIPSDWLFNLPFKRLKRVFINYQKNLKEIVKPIKNYEGYKISNRGYLISPNGNIIKGSKNNKGVRICCLYKKGQKKKTISIYRLVAKYFVKKPLKRKLVVNHILPDKNITDARNLEWVTYSENTQHYFDNKDYGYLINKIDPETNELMGQYNSPINAAKSVNKQSGSTIIKVLSGLRYSAYGFIWEKITDKLDKTILNNGK